MTKVSPTPESVFRKHGGVLRMSDALAAGLNRKSLYALRDAGTITQLSRGVYRLASLPELEAPDLVTVAARVPSGVVCLVSALAYHELTTQIPHAVDIALPRGAEKPRIDYPPVHFYWFSGAAFASGVELHAVDGQKVRIYSAEKSVADAFKYRNKLGLDVALEALRSWRRRRGASVERLLGHARACRVERVMRPYLEATT
ncbi:MAG TPA: type IV toxin-antitoxin system AbiEi family antitoxin domain-containing protein [Polyangiaceae bacterium]|nr:type IV toxin-antitoxin system AbiEi family antitoxin domain-containing protein [Polyangiaceae bacterium]